MSTAVVKARKKAQRATGTHHTKPVKEKTPVLDRAFIHAPVRRQASDAMPKGAHPLSTHRSIERVVKFVESGGMTRGSSQRVFETTEAAE